MGVKKSLFAALCTAKPFFAACELWDDGLPDVAVSVSVAPATVTLGDTARIVVEVRNSGLEDVTVWLPGCNMDFTLRAGSGTVYHPAEQVVCPLMLRPPDTLRRGAVLRYRNFSTGVAIEAGSVGAPALLRPGSYRVEVAVQASRGERARTIVGGGALLTFLPR